jgi:hypothetical protein
MSLNLYLCDDGLAVDGALDALMGGVSAPRRTWKKPSVNVWLSGALARPFLFGPVTGLKGWREAHEAAAAMAPAACGVQAPCVAFLEAEPSASAVLGTAVEMSVLDRLYAAAIVRGLRVASVRPAWALATEARAAEERGAPNDTLLCCREHDSVTVLASRESRLAFVATYAPAPTLDEQERLLSRLQASLGFTADETVRANLEAASGASLPRFCWPEQHAESPA